MKTPPSTTASLRRDLGLLNAIGIGLGAVMGAGIFVVTGVAAGVAGPAFLLGLVVAGIAATFNGLSSAQLAANDPQSGGSLRPGQGRGGDPPPENRVFSPLFSPLTGFPRRSPLDCRASPVTMGGPCETDPSCSP